MSKIATENDEEDENSDQELKQHFEPETQKMVVAIMETPMRISTATTILIEQFVIPKSCFYELWPCLGSTQYPWSLCPRLSR